VSDTKKAKQTQQAYKAKKPKKGPFIVLGFALFLQ
jgi:hypothetical protein